MADIQKTQKEMYQYIAELLADNEEVVAFCEKKIKQLSKRKSSPRKPSADVLERRENVRNYLLANGQATVAEMAEALGYSSPQVTGALRGLADQVSAENGEKKSAPKIYRIDSATEVKF